MGKLKERVTKIIDSLNEGIHERKETIAVSFLAALSDQNVFLFGPPGAAKSLIARRLSHAFETKGYFECLMHRFSTPEEVFGPVSITELKKDNFVRKTEGFLPQSEFAFLDEIWKSSPAILNTLLTIVNEKLFRNGTEVEPAPLKALIAASNETPPPGQGLEALYDRFLVRLNVPPIESKENFVRLVKSQPTPAQSELPAGLAVRHEEWQKWCDNIHSIELSDDTLNIIHDIRLSFEEKGEELDAYVSDRRWQKAAILLKASAFFCDREKTNLVDTLLLRHCLWTTKENYEAVMKIVEDAVRNCGFETGISLHRIDSDIKHLESEIIAELYHSEDVYETENLRGSEYFKHTMRYSDSDEVVQTIYIPVNKKKSTDKFHPIDKQGNELPKIRCCFDVQGICTIETNDYYGWSEFGSFTPKLEFHKGDKRIVFNSRRDESSGEDKSLGEEILTFVLQGIEDVMVDKKTSVNSRLVESLREAVLELRREIEEIIKQIEAKLALFKEELETPFVPENTRNIAIESVEEQLKDMKSRHKGCDHLESLIG